MPITNGYATLLQFTAQALPDVPTATITAQTDQIERAIQAASRLIDLHCDRHFWKTAAGVVRYFTPYAANRCIIDDLVSTTEIATDTDRAGTWVTLLTANVDYWLSPQSANGEPYTEIEITPFAVNGFYAERPRYVKVTGLWGWAAVPDVVREACLIQAFRLYKRAGAPFGVIGGGEFGTATAIPGLDPDVRTMLAPLVRWK